MLKWERGEAGSWVGRSDGFEYRTVVDFFDIECAQQKAEFQARHDARVAAIAAANGYVKLEPGQVVVQAELLEAVIADMRNDCDCSDGYCNNECGGTDCRVKDLTAALDASGGKS